MSQAPVLGDSDLHHEHHLFQRAYFTCCRADNKQSSRTCQVFSLQIYSTTRGGAGASMNNPFLCDLQDKTQPCTLRALGSPGSPCHLTTSPPRHLEPLLVQPEAVDEPWAGQVAPGDCRPRAGRSASRGPGAEQRPPPRPSLRRQGVKRRFLGRWTQFNRSPPQLCCWALAKDGCGIHGAGTCGLAARKMEAGFPDLPPTGWSPWSRRSYAFPKVWVLLERKGLAWFLGTA